jgi:branched-chain amino acid transport system ATP-binding protein
MADRVYDALKTLKAHGITLLLVEQNPERVGEVADRVIVLANGTMRLAGAAGDVLGQAGLGDAYLGTVTKEAVS